MNYTCKQNRVRHNDLFGYLGQNQLVLSLHQLPPSPALGCITEWVSVWTLSYKTVINYITIDLLVSSPFALGNLDQQFSTNRQIAFCTFSLRCKKKKASDPNGTDDARKHTFYEKSWQIPSVINQSRAQAENLGMEF